MTTDKALAPERRASFRDVLAIREFRALYVALVLSVLGDQLARIAVAVIVFHRTGSNFLTGLSYAVSYLPWILGGPLLSVYADQLPRRTVMVVCDVVRTVLVLLMTIPGLPVWTLITLVGFTALGEPPFSSARSSMIPDVVGEGDSYVAASTLSNSTNQLAVVVGFAIGGAFVATIGARPTLLLDALTFGSSAIVAKAFVSPRPAVVARPGVWRKEVAAGVRVVFADPTLRWLAVVTWLILGAIVSTEAAAVPYAAAHGRGSVTAGLLVASLPLGIVIGALVLGRAMSASRSERLMLPLAVLTPVTLAFTAFDPSPPLAMVLWFAAGLTSAMTVTANRVFMVSVAREVRGRAFGVAVTGIAAAQGLFSLLTGLVGDSTGPARAIADLALPTLALIVIFSIASANYRPDRNMSIQEVSPHNNEDPTMQARPARAAIGVWTLTAALVGIGFVSIPLLRGESALSSINLPVWWLVLAFMVGQAYPLEFEFRRQSFQVVLETVPLVLGLAFLPPLELVAIRAAVTIVNSAMIHRLPLKKWVFNGASTAVCTLAATLIFRALAPAAGGLHPDVWVATFAAVVASEVVGGALVLAVMTLSGASSQVRQTARVIALGIAVSVVMTFLAIVTAAALDYDVSTMWAISVFVLLVILASQTYHRVAERAAALDRLYVLARELGHIAMEPGSLAPAMVQLRQVMKASVLELAIADSTEYDFVTVVSTSDTGGRDDHVSVEERSVPGGLETLRLASPRDRRLGWLARLTDTGGKTTRIDTSVRASDREIGVLTATNSGPNATRFERGDVRLLEAAADQLAAAIEKGRLVDSLRRAATLDTLTGLANLESLRSFLDTSLEGSAGGVLILLNLDRFREVNDMLGHEAGDAVLAEVARRLQSSPTQGALFARVGGDQFAIAIPGSAGSEVARLAGMAVKSRVDGSLRLTDVSADIRVTVGIARAPDHGSDSATLLRRAEMAMAAAKGGTSGIGEWDPDYEKDGSRRLQLLTGLRAALGTGDLRVQYQPKLRLGSGEVTGFEALVRWTHPDLGPVSPAEFVPLAEATGLISALTSTVLREALTACRSWHDAGKPVGVAVNVSARSLDDNVLVGQVAAMLTASGLEPRWLTLEITESSVMEDHSRSLEVLRELRMLGVRLSIDDFGTGYSSLHQLRGLPVHEVKIDKSFVDTVDSDDADRAVVRAVVELCESLDLVTVAEGVERAAQAIALDGLGVRQVQGYFHSRPMDAALVVDWLAPRPVVSYAAM
jgi:diguanylate cyclase (GGDEF)-like protein